VGDQQRKWLCGGTGSAVGLVQPILSRVNRTIETRGIITDAEQLSYFTEVLKRLAAFRDQAPKDSVLSGLLAKASEPIGELAGYFHG
jgi:hypothetical protein